MFLSKNEQLTYGKAVKSQPGTCSAWLKYLDVGDGAYLGGSTNNSCGNPASCHFADGSI